MIVEEFYIDGKQVDIKDVSIVRSYKSPYFSDVSQILLDSTYTIKLPQTERNKAIMKYLHEADMNTDFPYTIHTADYIVDGMQIIRNGEVKVLGDFELQVVYGINREKYLPLKETKLNEITPNGTTILESDWMYNYYSVSPTAKFNILDFVSVIRNSDIETVNGVAMPKLTPPAPFGISGAKAMSIHPYISFENILNIISICCGIEIEKFDPLIYKLSTYGIIPTNNEDNYLFDYSINYGASETQRINSKLYLTSSNPFLLSFNSYDFYPNRASYINFNLVITIKIEITVKELSTAFNGLDLVSKKISDNTTEIIKSISGTDYSETDGKFVFSDEFTFEMDGEHEYYLSFTGSQPNYTYYIENGGYINIKSPVKNNVYCQSQEGRYNCIYNLPKIKPLEFISNLLSLTCGFIGTDFTIVYLDDFKDNLNNLNVYNWSGRISNVKSSKYQFNSNAQNNYIKYLNDEELVNAKLNVVVNDKTLQYERDLYKSIFKLPITNNNKAEIILYKQDVKRTGSDGVSFKNEHVDDSDVCYLVKKSGNNAVVSNIFDVGITVTDYSGYAGTNRNEWICTGLSGRVSEFINIGDRLYALDGDVLYETFIYVVGLDDDFDKVIFDTEIFNIEETISLSRGDSSYAIYQKLINRPIVKEVSVLLDFYESANIDFTKPVYIEEWGKYCMLLELTAPNKGLCEAKLLLINQTL